MAAAGGGNGGDTSAGFVANGAGGTTGAGPNGAGGTSGGTTGAAGVTGATSKAGASGPNGGAAAAERDVVAGERVLRRARKTTIEGLIKTLSNAPGPVPPERQIGAVTPS